jgi:hypothetical protein
VTTEAVAAAGPAADDDERTTLVAILAELEGRSRSQFRALPERAAVVERRAASSVTTNPR